MKVLKTLLVASTFVLGGSALADANIDLSKLQNLDMANFKKAALKALDRRRWSLESETEDSVVGTLSRGDDVYKAEIKFRPPSMISIRFLPGFAHKKETWLLNLKKDVLDELTE